MKALSFVLWLQCLPLHFAGDKDQVYIDARRMQSSFSSDARNEIKIFRCESESSFRFCWFRHVRAQNSGTWQYDMTHIVSFANNIQGIHKVSLWISCHKPQPDSDVGSAAYFAMPRPRRSMSPPRTYSIYSMQLTEQIFGREQLQSIFYSKEK